MPPIQWTPEQLDESMLAFRQAYSSAIDNRKRLIIEVPLDRDANIALHREIDSTLARS